MIRLALPYICIFSALYIIPLAATIRVGSEKAHYDGTSLFLNGDVVIEDTMGKLRADRAHLIRNSEKAPLPFSALTLEGRVTLQLAMGGIMHCDRVEGDLIARSFVFCAKGDESLHYQDSEFELVAERGEFHYEDREGRPLLSDFHLFNGIKMSRTGEHHQYVLADQVDYFPSDKSFVFKGLNSKVLFVDTDRGMQIAASEVIVKNRGEEIQGIGEVEFCLSEEQLQRVKGEFAWQTSGS